VVRQVEFGFLHLQAQRLDVGFVGQRLAEAFLNDGQHVAKQSLVKVLPSQVIVACGQRKLKEKP
jgi:hypothetical protein